MHAVASMAQCASEFWMQRHFIERVNAADRLRGAVGIDAVLYTYGNRVGDVVDTPASARATHSWQSFEYRPT